MGVSIPKHLYTDRYWKPVLYLFSENSKLNSHFTTKYFDFSDCTIKMTSLKRISAPWSTSEKFMLNLALHLFNERNKVNLSDMDYLDSYNRQLALKAIQMRFS